MYPTTIEHLDYLLNTGIPLAGNTGKVRLLIELAKLMDAYSEASVLDANAAGPAPLAFWQPLLALYNGKLKLTAANLDADVIERARQLAAEWAGESITLLPAGEQPLTAQLADQQFDMVVFAQESGQDYETLLMQVRDLCRPGGHVMFAVRSGYFAPRRSWSAFKTLRSQDEEGWQPEELEPVLAALGLNIVSRGYYCTPAIKFIHNQYVEPARKNEFLRSWYAQEAFINTHLSLDDDLKQQFMTLFYHLRKRST